MPQRDKPAQKVPKKKLFGFLSVLSFGVFGFLMFALPLKTRSYVRPAPHSAFFAGGVFACAAALSGAAYAQTPAAKLPPVDMTRTNRTFDIFVGQNKTGPYTLGWNRLHITIEDKALVTVNGNTLPPIAYQIDAEKGMITFTNELKAAQVVRVAYSYDVASAVRNANPSAAPLSVPLLQLGGAAVQVTALPEGSGKKGADSRPLVWSLSKKAHLLGGGLSSDVHYSGETGAAWKLGYASGNDKNGITAKFEQAGREFAQSAGKAFGVTAPAQTWEAGGRLRPTGWAGLQINHKELRDLALQKGGQGTNNDTLGLTLGTGAKNAPALSLVRTQDETLPGSDAIKDSTTVTTEKIDFVSGVGGMKGGEVPAQIAAKLTQTDADAAGKNADTRAQEIAVSVSGQTPDKKAQASVAVTDTNKLTATTTEDKQNILVKVSPVPNVTLSAEQKAQSTGPSDTVLTTAQTALTDAREKGDAKAETKAEDALKKLVTTETVVKVAQAEVVPLPNTKISGSVQTITTEKTSDPDAVKSAATDVSAQIGVGKAVEIAGGFTNRSASATGNAKNDVTASLNTTRARLALRPFGPTLTLSGGYTINPTGADNRIFDGDKQEFGLDAKVGALTLGSRYALTSVSFLGDDGETGDEAQYGEVSLTLGLRFSRTTKLSGNYKDALLYGGADQTPFGGVPRIGRAYGLDVTHAVGSGVSFSMGGAVVRDPAAGSKTQNIKGEAKLGVKF